MKLNEFPLFVHAPSKFLKKNENIGINSELMATLELVGNRSSIFYAMVLVFLLNSKECLLRKIKQQTKSKSTLNSGEKIYETMKQKQTQTCDHFFMNADSVIFDTHNVIVLFSYMKSFYEMYIFGKAASNLP